MTAARVITTALLLFCRISMAQSTGQVPSLEQLKIMRAQAAASEPTNQTLFSNYCSGMETNVKAACNAAYIEYFQYQANVFRQKQSIFSFEQTSTKIIFSVVIILVFSGLLFSALQFWYAFSRKILPWPAPPAISDDKFEEIADKGEARTFAKDFETDLEFSATGLKIRSSILGLLLLSVSMGFFFLYIRYVYPVQEGPANTQPTLAAPSTR